MPYTPRLPTLRPVALAIRTDELQQNRVFDARAVQEMRESLKPIAVPFLRLAEVAREAGFELFTADEIDRRGIDPGTVLLISYDWTPAAASLLDRGATGALLTALEPPVISWWVYYRFPRLSTRFRHSLLFAGARSRTAPSCTFHTLHFPQPTLERSQPAVPWDQRRDLVMVNSNKALARSPLRFFDRPRELQVKREVASFLYRPIARDLYLERLRAIAAFASHPGFDLFGEGWERRHPAVPEKLYRTALQVYRGKAASKLETLRQYRFSLVIENTRFPGYVSEKLFDCFQAGTIPLYLGAPNVDRHVPREAFVDLSQFKSYGEVQRFMADLSPRAAQRTLQAADAYLRSDQFQPFTLDTFARTVVGLLDETARASAEPVRG